MGLLFALLPWMLAPIAAFFLFFGDGPRDGPDPRDRALLVYLVITGLVALGGVALGVIGRAHVVRLIGSVVLGGGWAALAIAMLVRALVR